MDFDWVRFEVHLMDAAVDAIRALISGAPGQGAYAVAFTGFYAETGGVIYLPKVALSTEESMSEPSLRFSSADWQFQNGQWGETDVGWEDRLCSAVEGLPRTLWKQAWERFVQAMLNIAAGVRAALVAEETLPAEVLVFLDDEDAELLTRSLTPDEVRRHFPQFTAALDAEREVRAMPVEQRVGVLAAAAGFVSGSPLGALGAERARELLLELGQAAVPVAMSALAHGDTAWLGAKPAGRP